MSERPLPSLVPGPAPALPPKPEASLRALPRRAPIAKIEADPAPSQMQAAVLPPPPASLVVRRIVAWARFYVHMELATWRDARAGRDTAERRLERARRLLHAMGPGAVQIASQLAMRHDLLPDLAPTLAAVGDRQPHFDFADARLRIEEAFHAPLDTMFEAFDPTPITSSPVACEYQAILRTGEKVVVKVRRPGARVAFAAELAALGVIRRLFEILTLVRPGTLDPVHSEISALLQDETDFRIQARYKTLFRRNTKKSHLEHVTSARVHREYVTDCVFVSEFVTGFRLSEVIAARRLGLKPALEQLAADGIDLDDVARRLHEAGWWALFENTFFDAEPSADEIIVRPGGEVVFVGFGSFMTAQGRVRRLLREMFRRFSDGDVSGATEMVMQSLMPLPFIDTHTFSKRLEARLWQQYFTLKDPHASPEARSFAGVWRAILLTCGEDGVTVHQDLAAVLRSAVACDELAVALNPHVKILREFRRYVRRVDRRAARKAFKRIEQAVDGKAPSLLAGVERAATLADRMSFWAETMAENLPIANLSMTSKASYVLSEALGLGLQTSFLAAVGAVGLGVWRWTHHVAIRPDELVVDILRSSAFWLAILVPVLLTLRRLQFRLQDKDPDP